MPGPCHCFEPWPSVNRKKKEFDFFIMCLDRLSEKKKIIQDREVCVPDVHLQPPSKKKKNLNFCKVSKKKIRDNVCRY